MKILIVENDVPSALLYQRTLKKEGFNVTVAGNGIDALELLSAQKYDVVVTDWMMPKLDGLELIQRIRKKINPLPAIVMITAIDSPQARDSALDAGADDYLAKPFDKKALINHVTQAVLRNTKTTVSNWNENRSKSNWKVPFIGVGIAASTGGPQTLVQVFENLPVLANAAVFIVLHGPVWMLLSFQERLSKISSMPIHIGEMLMPIKPGEVYLAPGDKHMLIQPETMTIELNNNPPENFVRPSADPLFRSIAFTFGARSVSVVLTGMGHDGTIGSGYINAAGGSVLAQDPKTAILPSMPQTVIDLRIAKTVAPLPLMSSAIVDAVKNVEKN